MVSGHIRGQTNTLPLHIEILYNEYQTGAAFAVASLLALFGIFTLLGRPCWHGCALSPPSPIDMAWPACWQVSPDNHESGLTV